MEVFIKAVHQRPCLWNVAHKDYRNPEEKEEAWQSIVDMKILRLKDVKEAKSEWKKLRDNHRDSLKRIRPGKNGQPGVNNWRYSGYMEFLLPFMKTRKKSRSLIIDVSPEYLDQDEDSIDTTANDAIDTGTDQSENLYNNLESDRYNIEPSERYSKIDSKKRKIDIKPELDEEDMPIVYHKIQETTLPDPREPAISTQEEKHAIDLFLESMAITIKNMPPWMQTRVKRKIFAIVSEAEDDLES